MLDRINCQGIFKRNDFKSYSEFYLALCISSVCKARGFQLDMSLMNIESNVIPSEHIAYFKYLLGNGSIYIEGVQAEEELVEPSLFFDTTLLELCKDKLYVECKDAYEWVYKDFTDRCTEELGYIGVGKLPIALIHIVASFMLDVITGVKGKTKPLKIIITDMVVKNTPVYVNLVSCDKTFDLFNELISLDVDFSDFKVDLDYSILCNNGKAAKRNRLWTIEDKRKFFEKEGFKEGMIAILWTRKGMCTSNPAGRIIDASVVRLDKLLTDRLDVTKIAINKTKEELLDDYRDIPDEKQYLFADILNGGPNLTKTSLSLYDLGINNYFEMEDSFITLIDARCKVTKKITIDREAIYLELTNIDAIYWLLCQYSVDFDRALYRQVYNKGEMLLWDEFGEDEVD